MSLLPAQQAITGHPQDSPTDGSGNAAPFGVFTNGSVAESHVQILVPKDELPAAGAILTGMELSALIGGTVNYAQLTITVRPVTLTSLSLVFANNNLGPATTVLAATSLQKTWATSAWTPLPFTNVYVHDGVSALLVEIQKVVAPTSGGGGSSGGGSTFPFVTQTIAFPERIDRPQMVYVFGGPGSGGATNPAAFASAQPISFRLDWLNAPTFRQRSDYLGPVLDYGLGNTLELTVDGNPGDVYATMLANSFLPTAIPVPGIGGSVRIAALNVWNSGFVDAAGHGGQTIVIPVDPTLVGAHLAWQAVTLGAFSGALTLTNGSDHFINP